MDNILTQLLSHFGIPAGEVKNSSGQVVFPTNALERLLQSSDASAGQYAAAFMGPGKISPTRFPAAGDRVGGLQVHPEIPNRGSIGSSLDNYKVLSGVREVPVSAFENSAPPKFYSATEKRRTEALAKDIQANGYIKPLIIAEEKNNPGAGPYILEGGHRFDALKLLGQESFPALVVHDLGK